MDIRDPVLGILVGGSPAPGINGVISSVSIEALNNKVEVIGLLHGWKKLRLGYSEFHRKLEVKDISSVHAEPGSLLRTSVDQLDTSQHVDNALRVFEHLRIRYLVTIGGIETAHSAHLLNEAAKKVGMEFSVCHVPKTIYNDLPLPSAFKTFGFSTARDYGVQLVKNLRVDCKSLGRWYIVTLMGQRAGHLALGIAKGAASTVTLLPEDYEQGVDFKTIADTIEASMIKRYAANRDYGIACITQGIVNMMKPEEVKSLFGTIENGHLELAAKLQDEIRRRFEVKELPIWVFSRFIGSELRSANPNATDLSLARDLGYCAIRNLIDGGNGQMVAIKGGVMSYLNIVDMLDPSGHLIVRKVDRNTLSFEVSRKYQIRLTKSDLNDVTVTSTLAALSKMSDREFIDYYSYIAA